MQDIKPKNKTITFKAFSHPQFEKGVFWYIAVVLGAVILVGLFAYRKEYLAALALLVAGAVFVIYSKMPAKDIDCEISKEGVKIGDRFYPKEQLLGFWFGSSAGQNILYLESAKSFRFLHVARVTHVFLGEEPIEPIKKALAGYLQEKPGSEMLIDKIIRGLKI